MSLIIANHFLGLISSYLKRDEQLDDLQDSFQLYEFKMELYLRKEGKTRRISKGTEDLKDHLLQVEKKGNEL